MEKAEKKGGDPSPPCIRLPAHVEVRDRVAYLLSAILEVRLLISFKTQAAKQPQQPAGKALAAGGNQRDTDRARAQARKERYAKDGKSNLKTAQSDADKMRQKQAAAEAKKAALAPQKVDSGVVVKQRFEIK